MNRSDYMLDEPSSTLMQVSMSSHLLCTSLNFLLLIAFSIWQALL